MALIAAEGLGVRFGGAEVLTDVSLRIDPGEIVTIVGPNGSGKSTLLRAILGLIGPAGRVSGRVVRRQGLRIGYVPQRLHVDSALPMPVSRFLSLPQRHSSADMAAALDRVGVPGVAGQQMAALSGGQFQRVLLARALLSNPDILVLDEPTQGLDQPGIAAFYQLLDAVRRERGCAVLLVGHDLHVVMSAADRVICLNGHICCEGAPHVVSNAPEYRALFGLGTGGALALYPHVHDHRHDAGDHHGHSHHDHTHFPQGAGAVAAGPAQTPHDDGRTVDGDADAGRPRVGSS